MTQNNPPEFFDPFEDDPIVVELRKKGVKINPFSQAYTTLWNEVQRYKERYIKTSTTEQIAQDVTKVLEEDNSAILTQWQTLKGEAIRTTRLEFARQIKEIQTMISRRPDKAAVERANHIMYMLRQMNSALAQQDLVQVIAVYDQAKASLNMSETMNKVFIHQVDNLRRAVEIDTLLGNGKIKEASAEIAKFLKSRQK